MKYLSLLSAAALVLSANAQAESIEDALIKCSNLDNSLQRLVCFDNVVKNVKQFTGPEKALESSYSATPAAPRPAPRQALETAKPATLAQSFGLENKAAREEIDEISATVTAVDEAPRGELIITLSDGAVWRQKDSGHFNLKVGDVVKIERGMLSAFYLSKPEQNKRIKVKRTK